MSHSALYEGAVTHLRLRPVRHRLRYSMFNIFLDLDELPSLAARLRLFSYNRPGLFSFYERDHGGKTATGLRHWVEGQLNAAGLGAARGGAIRLLCMPRILGHAFNPISVFFCHFPDGRLAAMLYEVRNTFGERHSYLVAAPQNPVWGGQIRQDCEKKFYVSPFMKLEMSYHFRVTHPGEKVSLAITGADKEGPMIVAAFSGQHRPLTDRALVKLFLRMPLLGAKVLAGIHWEAARLYAKGLRIQPRPAPPAQPVTFTS